MKAKPNVIRRNLHAGRTPVGQVRPIEMGRDLDDSRPHDLRLVDDLGVDLVVHRLEVERIEKTTVIGPHQTGDRPDAAFGHQGQEAIGCLADEQSPSRNARRLASGHVRRSDDHPGLAGPERIEHSLDVVGGIRQVGVEGDYVVGLALGKGKSQRLPDSKIARMANDPDPGIPGRKLDGDVGAAIGAAVVDDQKFPSISVGQALQVSDQGRQVGCQEGDLVEHRQDQRERRPSGRRPARFGLKDPARSGSLSISGVLVRQATRAQLRRSNPLLESAHAQQVSFVPADP